MVFLTKRKISLIIFLFIVYISFTNTIEINSYENEFKKSINIYSNLNTFFRNLATEGCSKTSYSKSEIQDECDYGPNSYERVLKYSSFSSYISNHDYHSNGLNYVTSLFVDTDSHHFGNFMNDGVGMIILYIIDGLLLIGWIPLLCCWKKRCALFDECLYEDDCCNIFWHILTYFLAAAIFSFLIVVLCFGK